MDQPADQRSLFGLPFVYDGPSAIEKELETIIAKELEELKKLRVKVTRIFLPPKGGSPRYSFTFPADEQHYLVRNRLEANNFDVGQQMGPSMLQFYVSRRATKSAGWEV